MAPKNLSQLLLLLLLLLHPHLTNSLIPLNSSLKPPQPQSPNSTATWSSTNNFFSFGFLPDPSNTSLFSAAVILSPSSTPVWRAPSKYSSGSPALVDSSASIQFQSNGNLRLIDGSGSIIWQSNTSNRGVSVASLDDSGNLALKNATSTVIWDTFSNPTDTVLQSQNLTTASTLRSGPYSFSLLPSGNLTLKWNDNITYYNKLFNSSFSPNQTLSSPVLSLETNGQTTGTLFLIDASQPSPAVVAYSSNYGEASLMRFIRLDTDGNLRAYSLSKDSGSTPSAEWSVIEDQCEVFGYCGNMGVCTYNETEPVCRCPSQNFVPSDPNDPRKGCKRKQEISECPTNSTMLKLDNTQFLTYPPELASEVFFVGISACRLNCLTQTGCVGSTSLSDGSGLCYLKVSNFVSGYQSPALLSTSFVRVCPPALLNQPVSVSSNTQMKKSGLSAGIVVAVVVGTLVGLVLLEGVVYYCFCRGSRFGAESAQYALLEYASGAPIQFSYKELQNCTKGFREKLGEGGFGAVYRGTLANRTVVAVKRLEGIEQGEKQFRMEVATISSTHHLNLVRLIGFCSEGRHRLLVYGFMKNGSLDCFLFSSMSMLGWETRFNIALGTARGITYLHEECRDCIVHCDIKPENILLDENFNAKVSDFGLAKLINPKDHRHRTLTSVRGTRGYLAPEWLANLPITSKSDVYSYGMVLLETVSGRRNFDVSEETGRKKFSVWAYEEFDKGNVGGIVDKRLNENEIDAEQLERAIEVCFWCIQEQPSQRPTMGKVVQMLEGIMTIERPPAPKALDGTLSITSGSVSVSANSTFAASAAVPSSSSSLQALGGSSSVSGRNNEKVSSSLYGSNQF